MARPRKTKRIAILIEKQYQDMEVDLSGTNLYLPNNLTVGQTLPDADLLMNVSMTPINMKIMFIPKR